MIQSYPPAAAGTVTYLTSTPAPDELDELSRQNPGAVFAVGTRDEIEAIAARIRVGALEQERRAARRKTQRASRKRNRPH